MITMNGFSFIYVLIATMFVYYYVKGRKKRAFFKGLPGPPGVFLLGNALELNKTSVILDTLLKYMKTHGNIVKLKVGPQYSVQVTDYKLLEFILGSNKVLDKTSDYKFLNGWLGTGLLTGEGLKWKQHRRLITPAFHFKILEEFVPIFDECSNLTIKKLEKVVDQKSVDIYAYITLLTLDIICETAMGFSVNAQNDINSEYAVSVREMCKIMIERSFSPMVDFPWLYPLTPSYYKEKKIIKILHSYTNKVIEAKLLEGTKSDLKNKENCEEFGIKRRKAFLDSLLEARMNGEPLTKEEIREEVDTFMFAGHDTTSSGISLALYSLARNPEIQQAVYDEQVGIFGKELNKEVTTTYSNLQDMKYLELVIKETLRLYPSAPFIGRETTQDVEYNGQIIPSGVQFLIFIYGAHRNPEYFPDPEKFDPLRFENKDTNFPFSYIPFSAGPRNCVGQKFAMLEMKSIISKIVRNFQLTPANPEHKLELVTEIVLKSQSGVCIGLKKRL